MERNGMAINKEKENLDCVMIFLSYFTNSSYREREKKEIFITHFFFLGCLYYFIFFSLWVTLTI